MTWSDPSDHDSFFDDLPIEDPSSSDQHPDIRSDQPGKIPESLINAAIDGELPDDIQNEIARALNYDKAQRQDLMDTVDAINALQMPIHTPDFSSAVLDRANRHRRFIPASWRKQIRTSRLAFGIAAMLLLTGIATIQHINPRYTTLIAHQTPIQDFESAVEQDAHQLTATLANEADTLRASMTPFNLVSSAPGIHDHHTNDSIHELRSRVEHAHSRVTLRTTYMNAQTSRFVRVGYTTSGNLYTRSSYPNGYPTQGYLISNNRFVNATTSFPQVISVRPIYSKEHHKEHTDHQPSSTCRTIVEIEGQDLP